MRGRVFVGLLSVAFVLTLAPPASASVLARSAFNSTVEGWTVSADGGFSNFGIVWASSAPASGGFASAQNSNQTANYTFNWIAPKKFLGRKLSAFRGKLLFQQAWFRTDNSITTVPVVVTLTGRNGTVLTKQVGDQHGFDFVNPPDQYDASLAPTGWQDVTHFVPATARTMKAVLNHLALLKISMQDPGSETTTKFSLDNVILRSR